LLHQEMTIAGGHVWRINNRLTGKHGYLSY
jgi:hypothetical protein